jgi:hypothetical protein
MSGMCVADAWRVQAKCADPTLPPPSPTRPAHRVAGAPAPPPSPPPLAAIAHYNNCLDDANNTARMICIELLLPRVVFD